MDLLSNMNDTQEKLSWENFRNEVLSDYKIACISQETSLLGRKEVLTGKAKFGIFGDGKEVAQIAMAKFLSRVILEAGITVTRLLCLPANWLRLSNFLPSYMQILM